MPTASYRLQLTPEFGFDAAREQLDVIAALGVSHLYLSPIAQAVPTSSHGYDVTDHTRVRDEFGGEQALVGLLDAAGDRGMGVIIDHVPNHVSVERAELNEPWWTMLRDGPSSSAARWFDVDWAGGGGTVVIPRLGEPLTDVLDAGAITTGTGARGPELRYGPLRFPLAAGTERLDVREAVRHQHYTLSWWRDPARNVRRFFTIDDLVAVRVENPEVAATIDTIPRRLVEHPAFAGVRVDHVDGLAEPGRYLDGLREILDDRLLFVEKILAPGETLPERWPVDGTTGYEHITAIEHTLLDPTAEQPLMDTWTSWVDDVDFHTLETRARHEVLDEGLAPDLDRLVRAVDGDDSGASRSALVELTVALDRYRTYLPADAASRAVFDEAVARARATCLPDVLDRVVGVFGDDEDALRRWQELSGPVMAKGAEDRAFYRYFPLAALCEVGGAPGIFSTPIGDFHRSAALRQREDPIGMLASTTHDTKRSQGVRARSIALAAQGSEWAELVDSWAVRHRDLTASIDAGLLLLALQTAVTARPLTTDRLTDYLVKAAREADRVTSWTEPDPDVEDALHRLADVLVAEITGDAEALGALASQIEIHGARIDLALLAVQLTCPGFADLYQGSPRGLYSLVDPDNRTPPDWERLRDLVDGVSTSDTATAFGDGRIDLARTVMTSRILALRTRRPEAFGVGADYAEVPSSGPGADEVLAYARSDSDGAVLAFVTTRPSLPPVDPPTELLLPIGAWRSLLHDDAPIITGGAVRLTDLLGDLGLAVLERTDR
ncbi:malto-oligosyltrehalose synthase [Ilumatobacter sp.]|uniref:malto-oligosyltrehalose synthase n=1 Tax=Ilumatobacter sp. TaxID=1967498 RepID=UPI003C5AE443